MRKSKANKPWTWQPFCYPCGSFVTVDHLRREDHCRRAAGAPGTHYRSHPRQDEYETFDFDYPVCTVRYQHQFDFEDILEGAAPEARQCFFQTNNGDSVSL